MVRLRYIISITNNSDPSKHTGKRLIKQSHKHPSSHRSGRSPSSCSNLPRFQMFLRGSIHTYPRVVTGSTMAAAVRESDERSYDVVGTTSEISSLVSVSYGTASLSEPCPKSRKLKLFPKDGLVRVVFHQTKLSSNCCRLVVKRTDTARNGKEYRSAGFDSNDPTILRQVVP